MLFVDDSSTKMLPEPIGRFFPDQIKQSRDSKLKKTRRYARDILISNTINEQPNIFRDYVARKYVWSNSNQWCFS